MKRELKSALSQGFTVFIGVTFLNLIINPEVSMFWIMLFGLFLGILRGISVYSYRKRVIEDERLLAMRQKAQAIWFNIVVVGMAFIPSIGIFYTKYIQNPSLFSGDSPVMLEEVVYIFMPILIGIAFVGLLGSALTEKRLMKKHEK